MAVCVKIAVTPVNDRAHSYSALVAARAQCRVCANLVNPATVNRGNMTPTRLARGRFGREIFRADLMVVVRIRTRSIAERLSQRAFAATVSEPDARELGD